VDITLLFQHPTLYEAMQKEGIDSQAYELPTCSS